MPNPDRQAKPEIELHEQRVLNKSFDRTYDVLAVELLAENAGGTALDRVKVSDLGGGDGHVILAGTETEQKDDANYGDGLTSGIASTAIRIWNGSSYDRWDGTIATTSTPAKATDAYAISNEEDTGTYEYYGFEDASGNWYILRVTSASGVYQYAKGASNYSTAWTNRASQSYGSYSSTF